VRGDPQNQYPEVQSVTFALPAAQRKGEVEGYVLAFEADVIVESAGSMRLEASDDDPWWGQTVPIDVHSYQLRAKVHVEMAPGLGYWTAAFAQEPLLDCDFEVHLKKRLFTFELPEIGFRRFNIWGANSVQSVSYQPIATQPAHERPLGPVKPRSPHSPQPPSTEQ
jgi:hypothetical protein